MLLVAVVFMLVLAGSVTPMLTQFTPPDAQPDGIGDLDVVVTDQDGNAIAGETVQVLDPETGEILFEGTTDGDGELNTTLEAGEYDIRVGDTTQSTSVDSEDGGEAEFEIVTAPPDSVLRIRWGLFYLLSGPAHRRQMSVPMRVSSQAWPSGHPCPMPTRRIRIIHSY